MLFRSTATRASWDAHLEPNLRAPLVLTQEFARALPPDQAGNVINLLDQRVWNLTEHFLSYTVSKAALYTLTQTLALALAPRIRVNGVAPAGIANSQLRGPARLVGVAALAAADVAVGIRERTWYTRQQLERMPNLKAIAQISGMEVPHIDLAAAQAMIGRYFDTRSRRVQGVLTLLRA